jgi:hypothetical protein
MRPQGLSFGFTFAVTQLLLNVISSIFLSFAAFLVVCYRVAKKITLNLGVNCCMSVKLGGPVV